MRVSVDITAVLTHKYSAEHVEKMTAKIAYYSYK